MSANRLPARALSSMNFRAPICLGCALTHYLEEVASSEERSNKALYAATLLIDLGYFNSNPQYQDLVSMKELMDILQVERCDSLLDKLVAQCTGCQHYVECPVGKTVLDARPH